MTTLEIKESVDALGRAWEQYKAVNDARLAEIEKKGSADALFTPHLEKINAALDEQKSRLDRTEAALNRPANAAKEGEIENAEYKQAFSRYLRKGDARALEEKALTVNQDTDGGYLVTPQMSQIISTVVFESSPIRQLARVETISTDSLDVLRDADEMGSGWVNEEDARNETSAAQLGLLNIQVREMHANPRATQKLLDDASINVEAWLAEKIRDRFNRLEATAFVSGLGVTSPRGFLTYASGTSGQTIQQVNSGSASAVTPDGVLALFYSLKSPYVGNSSFVMNRTTVQAVRQLKESTTNAYIWQPGLALDQPDTLLGRPVYMAADMPVVAGNALAIAFGDFRAGYLIVDRVGIRTLRDPFSAKPFVQFYTTKRVGGDVVNFEAIKIQRISA